jgi:hypothetical protein
MNFSRFINFLKKTGFIKSFTKPEPKFVNRKIQEPDYFEERETQNESFSVPIRRIVDNISHISHKEEFDTEPERKPELDLQFETEEPQPVNQPTVFFEKLPEIQTEIQEITFESIEVATPEPVIDVELKIENPEKKHRKRTTKTKKAPGPVIETVKTHKKTHTEIKPRPKKAKRVPAEALGFGFRRHDDIVA